MKKVSCIRFSWDVFWKQPSWLRSHWYLENGQYYTANKELVKGQYSTTNHENGNTEATYTLENGVLNGQATVFYYETRGAKKGSRRVQKWRETREVDQVG